MAVPRMEWRPESCLDDVPLFFDEQLPVQAAPGVKMQNRRVIAVLLLILNLFHAGAQQDVVITSVWPSRGSLAGPLYPLFFFFKANGDTLPLGVGGGGGRSRCRPKNSSAPASFAGMLFQICHIRALPFGNLDSLCMKDPSPTA